MANSENVSVPMRVARKGVQAGLIQLVQYLEGQPGASGLSATEKAERLTAASEALSRLAAILSATAEAYTSGAPSVNIEVFKPPSIDDIVAQNPVPDDLSGL